MEIENNYQALVQALVLAITAPTEEQAQRAAGLAEEFAAGLDEVTVERAKKEAAGG
jgi:hypothetical protein